MNDVSVRVEGGYVYVRSPYNSDFVEEAKQDFSGKFIGGEWVFDIHNEQRVRKALMESYGSDGITTDTCTVRVTLDGGDDTDCGPITVCGRSIARARGRDSGATLSPGVVIVEGGFTSGGSVRNWTTKVKNGHAVVLIRDFPGVMARRLVKQGKPWISIEKETPIINRDALEEERGRLLARLAEINQLIPEVQKGLASA
ncbi:MULTISPECIES: hypothetical protein [Xanthomonas translucens group]|uniref:hypothetical protein n=1 Tax=Xanthomonas translucens group TaxID=3390202 RepID=UPI00057927B0|nr:hypothetical protein [Xanthomonas translucens]UKE46243.1 hypothetical protein KHA79_14065 [Xanthomonas translucens pv. cerealis]